MSVQEREHIERKAKALGMSLSDYVRMCALREAEPQVDIRAAVKRAAEQQTYLTTAPGARPFKCPVQPQCAFRATSPSARCPHHGRLVIP